jgi:hypothetical protein
MDLLQKKEEAEERFTKRIDNLRKKIKTIQSKDKNLTIDELEGLVVLRAQDSDRLLAGIAYLGEDFGIVYLSINGNCFAFLKKNTNR